MKNKTIRLITIVSILWGALLSGCGGSGNSGTLPAAQAPEITLLSSRPDMVSEGSALVQVAVASDDDLAALKISVNQVEKPATMTRVSERTAVGLITGLSVGDNVIGASVRGATATLQVKNNDSNGPIFSGPQQTPWVCQTASFKLPDGSMLGEAKDANCNAPTKVLDLYLPKGQTVWKALPATLPSDVQTTTTSEGKTVNLIVRLETGTLNRGIYQTAVLFDPIKEGVPGPAKAYAGWNKKVVFVFGGSTGAGYTQGTSVGNGTALETGMLSKGFAVVGSSLDVYGNNASDVLGAETAAMVKEHFIKTYGVPQYVMGWGFSGGSILQRTIANNYPGILDGITPGLSFPDLLSVLPSAMDCPLLARAFDGSSALGWTDAQKTAVAGYGTWSSCASAWNASYAPGLITAKRTTFPLYVLGGNSYDVNNCSLAVPASELYDPITNPTGSRCSVYDTQKNMLGIDPSTGFAYRPWDNEGVQYGLSAFQAGTITAEQFVQLNEFVGGYDKDGTIQSARSIAPAAAVQSAFENGRINEMAGLSDIPIIDWRNYTDVGTGDVHDSIRTLTSKARLARAAGSAGNLVIFRSADLSQPIQDSVLAQMDQWLSGIKSDKTSYPTQAAKVVANKPTGLVDICFDVAGNAIAEPADINNSGQCGALYPFHKNPRLVAGAPLTDDVLKCQLKPIQQSDYPASLTNAQFVRLSAVFASGVCDFEKASVGFSPSKGIWLSFASGKASPLK